MRKTIIAALAVMLIAGAAFAKDYEVKKKAGEYEVEVGMDKNPPVAGENNVKIEIKDASGAYVTDAAVTVEYSMPPMPGMAPMSYKAEAKAEGNEYKTRVNLSMSGPWNMAVKIKRGGKTETMKFTVDAR